VDLPQFKNNYSPKQTTHSINMPYRVNVDQLLIDLRKAASAAGFAVHTYGQIDEWPLYAFTRRGTDRIAPHPIYLSSGIHGDEPAGPFALLQLLQSDALPPEHDLFLCPVMNPSGLAAGTRENATHIDLNRDYTNFSSIETTTHRDWCLQHIEALDLALHLHEDWEAQGFYLYELNFAQHPSRSPAILNAVAAHLPIETAQLIDDFPARDGIIRATVLPDVPEGMPEAIYFYKQFGCINHTLETPSSLPLEQRVAAMKAAVLAAISFARS
jgi:protein MpaA